MWTSRVCDRPPEKESVATSVATKLGRVYNWKCVATRTIPSGGQEVASLQKLITVRYIDRKGERCTKDTPGARKVKEESSKWYACYREGKKQVRVPLATDKAASQVMLSDILKAKERGVAGLLDPFKANLDKPLSEHVADYLDQLKATASVLHHKEQARILNKFVKNGGCNNLRDVKADKVTAWLASTKSKGSTRNAYRLGVVMLLNWLEASERIDRNPITRHNVRRVKKGEKRQRRAMTAAELQLLLQTVKDFPVTTALKGGRPSKATGTRKVPTLKPAYLATLQHRGRERHLIYRVAILTGLRRGELSRLKVSHLDLDRTPFARLTLPGTLTKSGKAAKLYLVPSLASDLRQWIDDTGRKPADQLFKVPGAVQMSVLHVKHMATAGIEYEKEGKFADFHSLRMCGNVLLRQAGIPAKERQLFLRHATLSMTTEVYDDEDTLDMGSVVRALESTNL